MNVNWWPLTAELGACSARGALTTGRRGEGVGEGELYSGDDVLLTGGVGLVARLRPSDLGGGAGLGLATVGGISWAGVDVRHCGNGETLSDGELQLFCADALSGREVLLASARAISRCSKEEEAEMLGFQGINKDKSGQTYGGFLPMERTSQDNGVTGPELDEELEDEANVISDRPLCAGDGVLS